MSLRTLVHGEERGDLLRRLAPGLAAIATGLALLFVAGFAGSEILHAAAHDGRHAFAFPCH